MGSQRVGHDLATETATGRAGSRDAQGRKWGPGMGFHAVFMLHPPSTSMFAPPRKLSESVLWGVYGGVIAQV